MLLCLGATSWASSLRFENPLQHLDSATQQLSGINAIAEGPHGFIWLGGEHGLGRFDGHSLKLYKSHPDVEGSLPANYVWQVLVDHDGVMWVASEGGLSRYRPELDNFETLKSFGSTSFSRAAATSMAVGADNTLYVGTWHGLYRIDPKRRSMQVFRPDPPVERAPTDEQIRDIEIAEDGTVWMVTTGMGAAAFNPSTETFEYFVHQPDQPNSLVYNNGRTLHIDNSGKVWIGTYGEGISVYDPNSGNFHTYRHNPDDKGGLLSSVVWDIYQDSRGTVWITLDQGGLARFDEATRTFEHFLHHPYNPSSVKSNQLRAIYEDRNGDLWIGAFPSGVSFYNRSKQIFDVYTSDPDDPASLSHEAVTTLMEDSHGVLWVGTEGGANAMDRASGTFRQYRADPGHPYALQANPVLAIEEDFQGNLWFGTWAGGLHRFDRQTERFYPYVPDKTDPNSISSKFIWDILEDSDNKLWIATETSGLHLYQRDSDSFTHYRHDPQDETSISDNFVWTLIEDTKRRLWAGTVVGLNVLDAERQRFYRFPYGKKNSKAVSNRNVRSLYEDSRGLIWAGTQERGVSIYDPAEQRFRYLDVQDGLPSSTVSSILEDDEGDIWLATSNGLVHVNYEDMSLTTYGKEHGLAGSNHNHDASLKDSQGNLYFGSTEGLTVFHPDKLSAPTPADFPIRLTGFRILNQEVPIGEDTALEKAIVVAEQVRLSHKDIMFSFDFAALDYRNLNANRYAYKLEGFDRDWHYVTQPTATYTNIDPGTYTFRVKASNGYGMWNEDGPAVTLIIEPPPWRTWWAYLGYAGIVIVVLYYRSEYRRLRVRAESYKTQSITDPLTELYNRAGIGQVISGLFASPQTRTDAAVMLMDIDHFKPINDLCGHDVGDRVLQDLARVVLANIRRGDYLGRWGGEEFILICPRTTGESARVIADKIRRAVATHDFHVDKAAPNITISIGIAIAGAEESFPTVLKKADIALYQAKANGRNCVRMAEHGLG